MYSISVLYTQPQMPLFVELSNDSLVMTLLNTLYYVLKDLRQLSNCFLNGGISQIYHQYNLLIFLTNCRPVSAYALFFRDTQAAIKGQNPSATFGEVSKIVASMWDGLDPEHKSVSITF